jgi:hypothetical protein
MGCAMKNKEFLDMLHRHVTSENKKWTVGRLAEAIGSNRSHVNSVLMNVPEHGHRTRKKLVLLFIREFPVMWRSMVASLNWDENGSMNVPQGTLDVEQKKVIPKSLSKFLQMRGRAA